MEEGSHPFEFRAVYTRWLLWLGVPLVAAFFLLGLFNRSQPLTTAVILGGCAAVFALLLMLLVARSQSPVEFVFRGDATEALQTELEELLGREGYGPVENVDGRTRYTIALETLALKRGWGKKGRTALALGGGLEMRLALKLVNRLGTPLEITRDERELRFSGPRVVVRKIIRRYERRHRLA